MHRAAKAFPVDIGHALAARAGIADMLGEANLGKRVQVWIRFGLGEPLLGILAIDWSKICCDWFDLST
jgi:hypothetical protein